MEPWPELRTCSYSEAFDASMVSFAGDFARFDDGWRGIEEAIAGATLDRLDEHYPADENDVRLVLTDPFPDVPALRVAFRVRGETCEFLDLDRRELAESFDDDPP